MRASICSVPAAELGECPIWDEHRGLVRYLDLTRPRIFDFDPTNGRAQVEDLALTGPLGGLFLSPDGMPIIACSEGLFELRLGSAARRIMPPHPSFASAPPNDMALHPAGHVLVATADRQEVEPTGGIFRRDGECWVQLADGFTVGNGPGFSPDGSVVYAADSPTGIIYAFDWNPQNLSLDNQRVFVMADGDQGLPDGLCVDRDGSIWSARWDGGCVLRYSPAGQVTGRIEVPVRNVTSCVFGGKSGATLFITTARSQLEADRYGGHLFAVDVNLSKECSEINGNRGDVTL